MKNIPISIDMSVAFSDVNIACQHFKGGRLARSVDTQKSEALAFSYAYTEVVHSYHATLFAWSPVNLRGKEKRQIV